jgi:SprT protein
MYYLAKSSDSEIRDTILHEIAHALVGPNVGHGLRWRLKCVEIGAKPERLAGEEAVSTAKPNYVIECSACGKRWERFRLRRKLIGAPSVCCNAPLKAYRLTRKG